MKMMHNQRGAVSGVLVTVLTVVGILVVLGLVIFGSYVSAYNYGNSTEAALRAKLNDNKNILGQYSLKVNEIAQVPGMYKNDLIKLVTAQMQGRYGPNGSQATMQWIKEQNPNLDSSMYKKIQEVMEAGRNQFQASQTDLLDRKREYESNLGSFWTGMWLRQAGYPKLDLRTIKIVVAADTDQKFDTGIDTGIKLPAQ